MRKSASTLLQRNTVHHTGRSRTGDADTGIPTDFDLVAHGEPTSQVDTVTAVGVYGPGAAAAIYACQAIDEHMDFARRWTDESTDGSVVEKSAA
jgi:hypothetical protein